MGIELDGRFWYTVGVLLAFGIAYNHVVAMIERKDSSHGGYTSLLVVGGVMVTLTGLAVTRGLGVAVVAFFLFVASGTPMIVGAMWRRIAQSAREQRLLEAEARKHLED